MNTFDESKHPRDEKGRFAEKDKRALIKQLGNVLREKYGKLDKLDDSILCSEQDYNAFGWVRANNVINIGQMKDFENKFSEATTNTKSLYNRNKTKYGEYMIPVSDIYDDMFEGVNNVIIFAKGTIDKPIITKILQIYEYEETELDKMRRVVYASERRGIQQKNRNLYRYHNRTDYGYDRYIKRNGKKDA